MNILITGIAGFIGFHTAKAFKQLGHNVFGIDNFNAYYDVAWKKDRATLLKEMGIVIVEEDLNACDQLEAWVLQDQVDCIVHLAAQAGVRYATKNPLSYVHSNIEGLVRLLEIAAKKSHIPVIFASSSSVYSQSADVPFQETTPTDLPSSLYAATKKSGELIAHAYHHIYGQAITCLRFFTVYGPWGRPDMAYFSFTQAISEDRPITLFGKGLLQRDFTYIDDIVQGIIQACYQASGYQIFNLGGSKTRSVLDLVNIIENKLGKKARIHWAQAPVEDAVCTWADVQKSSQILSFTPKTSLEEGMEYFLDWYIGLK